MLTGVRDRHRPAAHRALSDAEDERERLVAVPDKAASRMSSGHSQQPG